MDAVINDYLNHTHKVFTIRDWVAKNGYGALSRLAKISGVSISTAHRASKGTPVKDGEAAIKLSEATGGEVSIRAIIRPDGT